MRRLSVALLVAVGLPCLGAEALDMLRGVGPYDIASPPSLAPSWAHPLGTDALGRDHLSRVLHGGRVSIAVAFFGAVFALGLGTAFGVVAGFTGGAVEVVLMRLMETIMALPKLPLMLLLAATDLSARAGLRPGAVTEVLALVVLIGLFSWMDVARIARAATRSLRGRDFVLAAEGFGQPPHTVLRNHVLPHLAGPLGTAFALDLGENVLLESALSFLGLGISPPTPSWGTLLARGMDNLHHAPWLVIVPGVLTLSLVAATHMLAEDLRVRWDPSCARTERG